MEFLKVARAILYVPSSIVDDEERMERVVFHPDYTYSDFVGQILPNVTEKVVN